MKTEILNARVIDPANRIDQQTSVFIDQQTIAAVGYAPDGWHADQSIDGSGEWLIPGLVDIAVRLREPGQEQKATIVSETIAALSSGVTSMACFPDTDPPIDSPAQVELVQQKARAAGYHNIYVIGALTARLEGQILTEMAALKECGCVGVTNAYQPVENTLVLRRAMEYASSHDLTLFIQPQDHALAANGCAHEGISSTRMGLPAIPSAAETAAIGQLLAIIEQTISRTHFCRLSTSRGLQMLERARFDGLPISADLCAHQLFLSDEDLIEFDGNFHTLPPLRSREDMEGLRNRLTSPVLQAICSDHQPHEPDAKLAPFPATQPGISSIETLLPLCLSLIGTSSLTVLQAIALITHKPAEVLGINAGTLTPGQPADLCMLDPFKKWSLDLSSMRSAGKNSPFLNKPLQGQVTRTFLSGVQRFSRNSA